MDHTNAVPHAIKQMLTGPQTHPFWEAGHRLVRPNLTLEPLSERDEDETMMEHYADDDAGRTVQSNQKIIQ